MRQIKEVLRLKFEAKLSHEHIAAATGLSKGAVTSYLKRALDAGISWPLEPHLDDVVLEARLFRLASVPAAGHAAPDFALIHQELKRKGVTLMLLWEEYSAAHPGCAYRYSQFCFHYGQFRTRLKRSMRQVHRAGEKLFLDYAGHTVPVIEAATGEIRPAQIFVAVLGASSYTYAEATWSQQLPDWIDSHIHTFEFLGAVPALLVPDNLKSAIKRACRYEPEATSTYADLARHYGTAILPARPFHPRDKAAVEAGVTIRPRVEVLGVRRRDGRAEAVVTTAGELRAGTVVVAAGAWTPRLVRGLGLFVPVEGGKGYHVDLEPAEGDPALPVWLNETRVIATPLEGRLRLAGTLELAGLDLSVDRLRVGAIVRAAERGLPRLRGRRVLEVWRGLRPCTPDGLPIVGRPAGLANVTLATGHAMMGLTLAPITGRLVAELLAGERPSLDLRPLSPNRFRPLLGRL